MNRFSSSKMDNFLRLHVGSTNNATLSRRKTCVPNCTLNSEYCFAVFIDKEAVLSMPLFDFTSVTISLHLHLKVISKCTSR